MEAVDSRRSLRARIVRVRELTDEVITELLLESDHASSLEYWRAELRAMRGVVAPIAQLAAQVSDPQSDRLTAYLGRFRDDIAAARLTLTEDAPVLNVHRASRYVTSARTALEGAHRDPSISGLLGHEEPSGFDPWHPDRRVTWHRLASALAEIQNAGILSEWNTDRAVRRLFITALFVRAARPEVWDSGVITEVVRGHERAISHLQPGLSQQAIRRRLEGLLQYSTRSSGGRPKAA